MIILKSRKELGFMKQAGEIAATALKLAGQAVKAGTSTAEIDRIVREYIESCGAIPSFLGYRGFPASSCISVNDVVIHGIPDERTILKDGDIVSIDVAAFYKGFHADNAATFACGQITKEARELIDTTRNSLYEAIKAAVPNARVGDISSTVQRYVEARGYSVVRDYVGHGVGSHLHEDPSVPNFGTPNYGVRLLPGLTIAIEPMVNAGKPKVKLLDDNWTVKTADGSLSAHFEHTVAITHNGAEILTRL